MEGTVHRIMQYSENVQAEMVTQFIPSLFLHLLNQSMDRKTSVTENLNQCMQVIYKSNQ